MPLVDLTLMVVTGAIAEIDGSARVGDKVTFTLFPGSSISGVVIPSGRKSATVGVDGLLYSGLVDIDDVPIEGVELWANEEGDTSSQYRVQLPSGEAHYFILTEGGETDLATLIAAYAGPSDPGLTSYVNTHLGGRVLNPVPVPAVDAAYRWDGDSFEPVTVYSKAQADAAFVSSVSGNLPYARLPIGSGAWDTGAATTITITRSLTVSGTLTATLTGIASSATLAAAATVLATPRTINGVAFDGSANITIAAVAAAGTLTGTTLAANVVATSITSVGTLTSLTVSGVSTHYGQTLVDGGSSGAPGLAWQNEPTLGFYRSGAATVRFSGAFRVDSTLTVDLTSSLVGDVTLGATAVLTGVRLPNNNPILAKTLAGADVSLLVLNTSDVVQIAANTKLIVGAPASGAYGGMSAGDVMLANNRSYKIANAAGTGSINLLSMNGAFILLGGGSGGAPVQFSGNSFVSLPAAGAGQSGIISVDETNNRLIFYVNANRYYVVGTAV